MKPEESETKGQFGTMRDPMVDYSFVKKYTKKIDKAVFPSIQRVPLMHIIAAKAVTFKEALSDEFNKYKKQIMKNANTFSQTIINKTL